MEIRIEIHTQDNRLVSDLLGTRRVSVGQQVEMVDGATLTYQGRTGRKAFGCPVVEPFLLASATTLTAAAVQAAAKWLWAKLKDRKVDKLVIEGDEISVDEEEIAQALYKQIKEAEPR
jgi:hypothetical protein